MLIAQITQATVAVLYKWDVEVFSERGSKEGPQQVAILTLYVKLPCLETAIRGSEHDTGVPRGD